MFTFGDKMDKTVAFLDLDGVMVDLYYEFQKYFGISERQPAWEMFEFFFGDTAAAAKKDDFFSNVDWANLPKTPWADELYKNCVNNYDIVCFLTSPPRTRKLEAAVGKQKWCLENYPGHACIVEYRKWEYAAPSRTLIDDKITNCEKFIKAGGQAKLIYHSFHGQNIKVPIYEQSKIWTKN